MYYRCLHLKIINVLVQAQHHFVIIRPRKHRKLKCHRKNTRCVLRFGCKIRIISKTRNHWHNFPSHQLHIYVRHICPRLQKFENVSFFYVDLSERSVIHVFNYFAFKPNEKWWFVDCCLRGQIPLSSRKWQYLKQYEIIYSFLSNKWLATCFFSIFHGLKKYSDKHIYLC